MLRGHGIQFSNGILFLSLTIHFVLANSVDTDEMPHCEAFYLGFTVCQSTRLVGSGLHMVKG